MRSAKPPDGLRPADPARSGELATGLTIAFGVIMATQIGVLAVALTGDRRG